MREAANDPRCRSAPLPRSTMLYAPVRRRRRRRRQLLDVDVNVGQLSIGC